MLLLRSRLEVAIDVVHRDPRVTTALDPNVADAGEGQVRGGDQTALRCQPRELTLSLRGRCRSGGPSSE